MILCGWCGKQTVNRDRCTSCGHEDPARPWAQRGQPVPVVGPREAGRPVLTSDEMRRRLGSMGPDATDAQIADHFDVDERTVRRWRQKVSV